MNEIIHYGTLGQVEGLSVEIAQRFDSHLSDLNPGIDKDLLVVEIEHLKDENEALEDKIEDIRNIVL
jgi:hypothetical protein